MNRGTARRALRALPPLVALAAVAVLAAPAHADPPITSGGGPSQLTVVVGGPGPGDSGPGPKAAITASRTEHVVVVAAAGLPPPIIDD